MTTLPPKVYTLLRYNRNTLTTNKKVGYAVAITTTQPYPNADPPAQEWHNSTRPSLNSVGFFVSSKGGRE
jgi:hypothetical protein